MKTIQLALSKFWPWILVVLGVLFTTIKHLVDCLDILEAVEKYTPSVKESFVSVYNFISNLALSFHWHNWVSSLANFVYVACFLVGTVWAVKVQISNITSNDSLQDRPPEDYKPSNASIVTTGRAANTVQSVDSIGEVISDASGTEQTSKIEDGIVSTAINSYTVTYSMEQAIDKILLEYRKFLNLPKEDSYISKYQSLINELNSVPTMLEAFKKATSDKVYGQETERLRLRIKTALQREFDNTKSCFGVDDIDLVSNNLKLGTYDHLW